MRRNLHAAAGRIVIPSVVRADQAIVLHASARKFGAAMETKILPGAQRTRAAVAPQDDIVSEQPRRANLSRRKVRGLRDGVPIIKKNWVVDHDDKCTGIGDFVSLRREMREAGAARKERRISRLNRGEEAPEKERSRRVPL